ncbi:uncharacterized protein LOC141908060 [Tubulanus polymorphus]|uniref:uncharacterized protein LOC141908060 n=1 Tax=Tubulanus polymorphus TaxID=672921 RepID=UPI003DA22A5D
METGRLNVDILLRLSPVRGDTDIVTIKARNVLMSYLATLPQVKAILTAHGTAEDDENHHHIPGGVAWYDFKHLAVLMTSKAIVENEDQYGIYTMLDEKKLDTLLQETYSSPDWKKIGFCLYTQLFRQLVIDAETSVSFGEFIDDNGPFWAQQLIERVNQSHWLTAAVKGLMSGMYDEADYHRDMNILFLKIHMLDAKSVFPALQIFSKALPELRLELVTTDYLSAPLDAGKYASAIIEAKHKSDCQSFASNNTTCTATINHHGLDVIYFVLNEAKPIGLWTGHHADNRRELVTNNVENESCSLL